MNKFAQLALYVMLVITNTSCTHHIVTHSISAPDTAVQTAKTNAAKESLYRFFDQEWQRYLEENPVSAGYFGDKRYNHLWPDLSLAAIERSQQKDRIALDTLRQINPESLDLDDQLNYFLFEKNLENSIAENRFKNYLIPLNQRGGIQNRDSMLDNMRFETLKDYQDWLTRLDKFPELMQQTISLMRTGMQENILPPKIIMQRIPNQIRSQLVTKPTESGFYKPFLKKPGFVNQSEWSSLQTRAQESVTNKIIPSYRDFLDFFEKDYLPASRESIGASDRPNGQAFYQQRVARYTTTKLTYDEIHDIGQSEVKRIRTEMQKIIDQLGFDGSFTEFLHFLRTDPQFYYPTSEELHTAYLATSKRIDPELTRLFGKLPRIPYGIRPIPDNIAPDTTTAYYGRPSADGKRAGYYYVNLYKPETRPKYEIEVLTVHEAMPGHHLQIALAQELGDVPNFRRLFGFTAFVEGWALYSESLGDELGLYKDPYSKFGQLTYEMWRAVRLVVDTGMHAKGWSRQQAIDFFKANAAKTEHDIINEIDRYIAWPGQALAYKIGELKIKELRARAEHTLGDRFDIRLFHDKVLSQGAVPLDILENSINEWIAEQ